jgi:hypothetical protein
MDRSVRLTSGEFDTTEGVANYALKRLGRPNLRNSWPADGVLRSSIEVFRNDATIVRFLPFIANLPR